MYAQLDERSYPPGFEEVEWKAKKLKQLNWSYQVTIHSRVFHFTNAPEYMFCIIRWGMRPDVNTSAPREVLYEGSDHKAVVGYLSMLIKAEEERYG